MRFSAANLVITAETRNTRSARGPLVGGAACGSLTGGRLDDSVRRGSLPTNGLAFSHSAGGSRRTLWRFRTVRAAPDGILGRPHRADRFPTKFWAVRAERIASRRDFGPSAQCGRLPTDALAFPHSAGGSPTNGLGDGAGLFSQISMFSVKEFLSEGSRFCIRAYFFMQILKKASSRRRKSCR